MLTPRDGYEIDILVTGYPGKTVCHGALGWSTIVLLRGHGHVALIDTGAYGVRDILLARLAELGLDPAEVTDVLLTHAHFDHMANWTMFPNAAIHIGAEELAWAVGEPWGRTPVPELHVRELNQIARTVRLHPGQEVLPGLLCRAAPGHTPGHLMFCLASETSDVLFAGDAVKNLAELASGLPAQAVDMAMGGATLKEVADWLRAAPGRTVVPGHDLPIVFREGAFARIGSRAYQVMNWPGESLDEVRIIQLEA